MIIIEGNGYPIPKSVYSGSVLGRFRGSFGAFLKTNLARLCVTSNYPLKNMKIILQNLI